MARKINIVGALVRAHAQSVRQANARQRAELAAIRRLEQGRAAAARAEAAEMRAVEASIRAAAAQEARDAKSKERAIKEAERDRQRQQREAEQAAHLDAAAHAEALTLEAAETVEGLQGLITATLEVDDCIDFEALRVREAAPKLRLPQLVLPELRDDASIKLPSPPGPIENQLARVQKPGFFERLFGGNSRYEKELAKIRAAHALAVRVHREESEKAKAAIEKRRMQHEAEVEQLKANHSAAVDLAKRKHAEALAGFEEKRAQRDAEVTELQRSYAAGEPEAVVLYNEMVLSNSDYPAGFPG